VNTNWLVATGADRLAE